jgi:pimeloyl-ACP methyl ester carboxylesterase
VIRPAACDVCEADRMELGHDRLGAGPPLVLLHPLGADRRVWDPVLELLSAEREVIAVDLPGFGDSEPLEGSPTPRALADALAGFLRRIDVPRPHVAGNSLGGWVGFELALAGSARTVTGLAPAGLWPKPLMPKPRIARRLARYGLPLVELVSASAAGRRLLLAGAVAKPANVPAAAAAHLVRAYATAPGFDAVNAAMRAGRFQALERITVPVTLVWPEHDRLVRPPAWLPPRVRSRTLEGCGHIPMWDDPPAVARVLLESSEERDAPRSQLRSSLT